MTTIASVNVTSLGISVSGVATVATGAVKFLNNGKQVLLFKNATGATDLTIQTPKQEDTDLDIDDRVITVAAEDTVLVGPFNQSLYNDATGHVNVTRSAVSVDHRLLVFHL